MTQLDQLRTSRESYVVKLRDFLRLSERCPDSHIIFFEGQDSKYYSTRIEMLRADLAWESINCGGKGVVLKLFSLISGDNNHKASKYLFFVDMDFDEPDSLPKDRRVYVTPCYSIENLFVNESCFKRILKNEFGLSEHDENSTPFEMCLDIFRRRLAEFVAHSAELNGWIIRQRQHELANPGTVKINLSSINLSKAFQVDLEGVVATYTLAWIEKTTAATVFFSSAESLAAVAHIASEDRAARFRGKFQAYFFRTFLSKLTQEANSGSSRIFPSRSHVPLNVSDKNIISELCQYAETPACLKEFIERVEA